MTVSAPRWDLSNVYPSLDSKEFKAAVEDYKKQVAALEKFFKSKLSKADARTIREECIVADGGTEEESDLRRAFSARRLPPAERSTGVGRSEGRRLGPRRSARWLPMNSFLRCSGFRRRGQTITD